MKETVLSFPNNLLMAEYILQQEVSQVETNSKQHSLKGMLSNEQIQKACRSFDAEIIKPVGSMHYE